MYGLNPNWHHLADMSESDFYDAEVLVNAPPKKYDFIYICLKDDDNTCPMDGWNAINRNFKLAQNCFPIMVEEMGLRGLVVGRVNCGLEQLYGEKIEVIDFLPFQEFQEKLRESRFLFVPNVYDASPRVISEAIIKGVPVLLNRSIVCGSKYITEETGELFTDENDLRLSIERLRAKQERIHPEEWWEKHYSRKTSGKKLRDVLNEWYPGKLLETVQEVYFY
jgi:glycosyltransferase involved in cell wall biosynthesis